MAGRTGGNQVMAMDMKVVRLMADNNIIIVKGSVPGPKGGYVIITK
jgi:large subunit ribosomal protein L3